MSLTPKILCQWGIKRANIFADWSKQFLEILFNIRCAIHYYYCTATRCTCLKRGGPKLPRRKHTTFRTRPKLEIKGTFQVQQTFFLKPCHLWGNVEEYFITRQATFDNITRHARTAYYIHTVTSTISAFALLIAFPQQQRLHERVSILRYIYSDFLVLL